MAEALLSLTSLSVGSHLAKIRSLQSKARTYSKMGAPAVPGVPDIKGKVKIKCELKAKNLLEKSRKQIIILLLGVMGGVLVNNIPKINKIIRALNRIITAINRAIDALAPLATTIFSIIVVLTVLYVVTKIIGMLPAPGVGMGAVISFTSFITIVNEVNSIIASVLSTLWPLAYAIIAIMMLLLSIFNLLQMVVGMVGMFIKGQTKSADDAANAFSKTADDWANSTDTNVKIKDGFGLVECALPNGDVEKMSAEDCIAAGGTFPGMDLLSQMNDLDNQINNLNNMLGKCVLPDGSIKIMTPTDCAAAGGVFGGAIDPNLCWNACLHGLDGDGSKLITCRLPDGSKKDITLAECNAANGIDLSIANLLELLADLQSQRDVICYELGPLCKFRLDDNIITSLLNPHDDVTVEEATKYRGKRYGFYGSEQGVTKYQDEIKNMPITPTDELIIDNIGLEEIDDVAKAKEEEVKRKRKIIAEKLIDVKKPGG